jgi:CheY-like chemotaxis protein
MAGTQIRWYSCLVMSVPSSPRILLIDDDELSRAVLEVHLTEAGFTVVAVESGEAALALLEGENPPRIDAVLSDLRMPGLCGAALARALRSAAADRVGLIARSGSRPAAATLERFDAFLLKPFTPQQLQEILTAIHASGEGMLVSAQTTCPEEALPMIMEESMLTQLRAMFTPLQLSRLFDMAFAELRKHCGRMERAASLGDAATVRESAHAVKGSFAILGARELEGMAASLEMDAGTSTDQAASFAEILKAADRLKRMLTSHGVQLSQDPPSGQETQ